MENLDKNFDLKVLKEFRKELHCKKCYLFPRPDVKLMLCGSCSELLCSKCCGTECPLCQYESKDPKIPTFIQNSGLMKAIPGFKTQPCSNVKNGCHEEIPGNLDDLKKHDESCPFQMVPCPKMNCKETFIFKNLGDHLKQAHSNEVISIYYGTEKNEYTYQPQIFGIYNLQAELVNGRNYYENENHGIWFTKYFEWVIGYSSKKGQAIGFAKVKKDIPFPDGTTNWKWEWSWTNVDWTNANKGLGVKGIYFIIIGT